MKPLNEKKKWWMGLVAALLLLLALAFYGLGILWTVRPPMVEEELVIKKEILPNFISASEKEWPNFMDQLNCSKLFDGDKNYTKEIRNNRISLTDLLDLNINCNAIKLRWHFAEVPNSEAELEYPLAYARTDYALLEQMLSVEYQPQNLYCYSVDAKSDQTFKNRVRNLQNCFDNVIVMEKEYSVFSSGINVSRSHLECLEALNSNPNPWNYVFVLQNHDLPLKTNSEKVEILKIFNGTNDVSTVKIVPTSVDKSQNWTFADLQLYKNETKNKQISENSRKIYHTKSLNLVTLSRAAVDFVLTELNTDKFIDRLEKTKHGMDEVFFSSLNSNLDDMPGGFTTKCLIDKQRPTWNMGRYTVWYPLAPNDTRCKSQNFRHNLCVYGVEDLVYLKSDLLPFYLNKMMQSFDYGAVYCWLQKMANILPNARTINTKKYSQLPHVRYNRLKSQTNVSIDNCDF